MITLANDFLISYLFLSAIYTFSLRTLCYLGGGDLASPKLALGEFLNDVVEGLNCLDDCVPVVIPVVFLV